MNTIDLTLLTLTLKALGHDVDVETVKGELFFPGGSQVAWNPLTDNGDALSVAVKLAMLIDIRHTSTVVRSSFHDESSEEHGGDAMAATRRAIVRSAAKLAVHHHVENLNTVDPIAGLDHIA